MYTDQRDLFAAPSSPPDGSVVLGSVNRITYRSESTGYTVLRVTVEGEERTVSLVGRMPPVAVGERVRARGRWVQHERFGTQLEVREFSTLAPRTEEAIVRYLGSGMAAGIGPKLAERIVERFGADALDVIERRPEELTRIQGISPTKARSLHEAVRDNARLRDLTLLLEQNGLGARYAARIQDRYGESALTVVKEDPYRLARDIWGIGFVRADSLARSLGFDPEDARRIEAGLVHLLRRAADLGDVFLSSEDLARSGAELLAVDLMVVERGIDEARLAGRVVCEEDRVYTVGLHRAETDVSERLDMLLDQGSEELPFERSEVASLQSSHGIDLSPDQVDALRLAHEHSLLVITGGPGTGKTTLTRFLLDLLEARGLKLALAAPTGRAARRLGEATAREAQTLHRLLGFDPSTASFGRDPSSPIEADVVLVDESSMVDLRLFDTLLAALRPGCRLILVGDADQLPSVGPGEVLRDLMRSERVPVARLSQVYRQGERSGIVRNAHRILEGQYPETVELGEGDFAFVECEGAADVAQQIRRIVAEFLPKREAVDASRDVQVLVPMYKGDAGADALNAALQADLNPKGEEIRSGSRVFRRGDRVIQLRNDYRRNVFNGEIGHVEGVSSSDAQMTVRFDALVELASSEWDQLSLAYAITVHKSQGSEYDWVVFPLSTQHAILLDRPLFYTAITRARRGVILVGSRRALGLALRPGKTRARRTTLAPRLRGEISRES